MTEFETAMRHMPESALPIEAAGAGIEPARGVLRPRLPYELPLAPLLVLRSADGT
jgi:hypothetical protein